MEIGSLLRRKDDSRITLLPVSNDPGEGEAFLDTWVEELDLPDLDQREESAEVEERIAHVAEVEDVSLVIVGASEQGLLPRLVERSPVIDPPEDTTCSVLVTERAHDRSLRQRLRRR